MNENQKSEPRLPARRRAIASPPTSTVPRQALKLDEVGKRLGVSRGSVYAAARRGEIPTIRIGRLLLVPVPALDRMLDVQGT
jgi:excisionase family DNA binding protein